LALLLVYSFAFALAHWAGSRGHGSATALIAVFAVGAIVSLSRQTLSTGDLPVYVEGFTNQIWDLYYLREAPFWAVARLLTGLSGEAIVTFLSLDLLIVFLLTRVMGGRMHWQLVVLLMAFPTVLGFTNIYRQLLASVIMMAALREFGRGSRTGLWWALAACTVHIAMIGLCMSLLTAYLLRRGRRLWLIPLSLATVFGVLPLLEGLTLVDISGGTDSRGNTTPLYVALGSLIGAVAWWQMRYQAAMRTLLLGLTVYFAAGAISLLYAPASTGTRLMMISIHLMSFVLLAHLVSAPRRNLLTLGLAVLLAGPLLVSDSAWHLIFGYEIN
jgi:hypothetical protein